jgi:hypothetical protein
MEQISQKGTVAADGPIWPNRALVTGTAWPDYRICLEPQQRRTQQMPSPKSLLKQMISPLSDGLIRGVNQLEAACPSAPNELLRPQFPPRGTTKHFSHALPASGANCMQSSGIPTATFTVRRPE